MLKIQDHRVRVAASRREEMQNALLFSVLVLASDKSIHEIDVEDIINHAQVSRGSFYKYFPSVQASVLALASQLASELTTEMDAITHQIPDTAIRLITTAKLTMRLLVKIPLLGNFFIQLPWPSPSPEVNVFKNISADVELGIKEGLFKKIHTFLQTILFKLLLILNFKIFS
jgi:AcrR family transcriptional regulator